jgi:hypothetical protein
MFLLGIGFNYKVYKKLPNIRIFINDKFIDEYDIDSTAKIYQLNVHEYQQNIKLKIKNSDSNYNNGFMTKSTLLELHTFWFTPIKYYDVLYRTLNNINTIENSMDTRPGFNLLPYTHWTDTQNRTIKNVSLITVGGDGEFTCTLFKNAVGNYVNMDYQYPGKTLV